MKKKVAFVCIHNSCRSQMAEAWAKHLGKDIIEVYSAGIEGYHEVKPGAVEVMGEAGISMEDHYPKLLTDLPEDIDIVVTMGCGAYYPFLPAERHEDWGLEDPSGGPIEGFRKTRDLIKQKVEDLIKRVQNN
jgi:arsenate reductase